MFRGLALPLAVCQAAPMPAPVAMLPALPTMPDVRTALCPTDAEVRSMLTELIERLGYMRTLDALNVPHSTMRTWRSRMHPPSGTARRAIWLVYTLVCHPERLRTLHDLYTWGRYATKRPPLRPPGPILPASSTPLGTPLTQQSGSKPCPSGSQ